MNERPASISVNRGVDLNIYDEETQASRISLDYFKHSVEFSYIYEIKTNILR